MTDMMNPARAGSAAGSGDCSLLAGENSHDITEADRTAQAQKATNSPAVLSRRGPDQVGRAMTGAPFHRRPYLCLVPPAPQRPRRIEVRIAAADGRSPIGRSRAFHLTHNKLNELIAVAMRMERA